MIVPMYLWCTCLLTYRFIFLWWSHTYSWARDCDWLVSHFLLLRLAHQLISCVCICMYIVRQLVVFGYLYLWKLTCANVYLAQLCIGLKAS